MKALVVYESMYGNTAAIGEAIAASLRSKGLEVHAGPVTEIDSTAAEGFDLIVVGGPTHAHGMSSRGSRNSAVQDEKNRYEAPTVGPGLREWIPDLPSGAGRPAAAFDTRFDKPRFLTGSAAKGIAKRLQHQGYRLVAEPESFFVTTENQLVEAQTQHAGVWGAALAERAGAGVG